jgi:hypothetical protein
LFFATPTHELFAGQFSSDIAAPPSQTPFAGVDQLLCLFLGSAVVWAIQWDDFLKMAANGIDGCCPDRGPAPAFYAGNAVSEFSDDIV